MKNSIDYPIIKKEDIRFFTWWLTDYYDRPENVKYLDLIILNEIAEKYKLKELFAIWDKYGEIYDELMLKLEKLSDEDYIKFLEQVFDFLDEYNNDKDISLWIKKSFYYQNISSRLQKRIFWSKKIYKYFNKQLDIILEWLYEKEKNWWRIEYVNKMEKSRKELREIYTWREMY